MSELSRPLTFGLIHGSWHGPESWNMVRDRLEARGHTVVVVEGLPTQDPNATYEDHVRVATEQFERKNITEVDILAGHSGGGQLAVGMIALGGIRVRQAVFVSGSIENPPPHDPRSAAIPDNRSSDAFQKAILKLQLDKATDFDRSVAPELMYNGMPETQAKLAVKGLSWQFRLLGMPLPEDYDVPSTYILGTEDRVRDPVWARAIAKAYNMRFILMEGDHSLPLSQPEILSTLLMDLASRPRSKPSPHPHPRPRLRVVPTQRRPSPSPTSAPTPQSFSLRQRQADQAFDKAA